MRTLRSHSLLVLSLSTVCAGRAAAQEPVDGASAAEISSKPAAEGSAPIALHVEASGLTLDEPSVRAAILEELELDAEAPAGAIPMTIALRVVSGGELTVTIQGEAGQAVSRSVAAPGRADEVPEVTALLVGNLARDEASGVLSRLRTHEPAAEPAAPASPPEAERQLPLESANLSFVYPLTLRQNTDERRFAFELGILYSRLGALSGVGLELGVAHVLGSAHGVVVGGVAYWHGGSGSGVRFGGVLGVGGAGLDGVSVAGVTTVERGDVNGGQLSGAVNVAAGDLDGAQVAGVVNTARTVDGVQLSGALNVALGDVAGAQVSGAVNLAQDVDGVQLGSGVNVAERINGMQISLVNIGGDVAGGQIGIVNVARDVDGVQLGLVNVAREVEGVSLGLVPYSERGRTQAVAWFGSSMPFNLGVRFETGALYVMPTFGYDPTDSLFRASVDGDYAPGLSLGYRLNIDRAFADLDINYSSRSQGADFQENAIDLRYRLLAGFQITRGFGLFAGGGVRHHFRTQAPTDESVDPELSVGIQIL